MFQDNITIPVNQLNRNRIIKIALAELIKMIGHYYSESKRKEKLAAAIVIAFPEMILIPEGLSSHL